MKFSFKNILFLIAIILCFMVMATVFNGYGEKTETLTYGKVISYLEEGRVESLIVGSDGTTMQLVVRQYENDDITKPILKDNGDAVTKKYTYRLSNYVQLETIEEKAMLAREDGSLVTYNYEAPKEASLLVTYLPYILLGIGLIVLIVITVRASAKGGGRMGNFSHAKTKTADDAKNPVKFADVAGADEEKEELKEVVEF